MALPYSEMLRFTFIGIALDGYVELNAARTSIQRVVLFSNSGKSPYRFVFDVAMVQNCHFSPTRRFIRGKSTAKLGSLMPKGHRQDPAIHSL
jgi:hypothetical protein